jgi:Rieske Fe-S protein
MILADHFAGRENPWASAFDSTRIGDVRAAARLVQHNADVGKRFVVDRIARLRRGTLDDVPRGGAAVVKLDGKTVGAYRDDNGHAHAVSISCTHLGCTLRFNDAEASWDCPCHGSRFDHDGAVLEGPAVEGLERFEVEPGPS